MQNQEDESTFRSVSDKISNLTRFVFGAQSKMVRGSNGGSPPHLPSLEAGHGDGEHSRNGGGGSHSASLRGSHHNKVPEIANQPLNTLLPVLQDGQEHPEPYYITQNVVFRAPSKPMPWNAAKKAAERDLLESWTSNSRFQDRFVQEFLRDALYVEVTGICSATHAETMARSQREGKILSWLEDHVITDQVYASAEDCVWEALWDQARKLGRRDMEDLDDIYGGQQPDAHMMRVLRENYTRPVRPADGKSLMNHQWGELLYHLNRLMQRGSLMENYAIRKLQEMIITQVAAKVVLDEALKFMEDEMATLDEDERIENPPRQG